jgi:hypothetical protein
MFLIIATWWICGFSSFDVSVDGSVVIKDQDLKINSRGASVQER